MKAVNHIAETKIQQAASALVGLPLWSMGRAADLAWFEFGARRTVKGFSGAEKQVGDYALHVQCAWCMTQSDTIITGRGDIFCTPVQSEEPLPADFDWEKGNRFDRIVEQLFKHESLQLVVQSIDVGGAGKLNIVLEQGYQIEIFPHDSESGEHWRLFKPNSEEPHFVFSGTGYDTE